MDQKFLLKLLELLPASHFTSFHLGLETAHMESVIKIILSSSSAQNSIKTCKISGERIQQQKNWINSNINTWKVVSSKQALLSNTSYTKTESPPLKENGWKFFFPKGSNLFICLGAYTITFHHLYWPTMNIVLQWSLWKLYIMGWMLQSFLNFRESRAMTKRLKLVRELGLTQWIQFFLDGKSWIIG